MKYKQLIICTFSFLILSPCHALEELAVPSARDNSGQNQYERLGSSEKDIATLYQAYNSAIKTINDLSSQVTALKEELKKSKEGEKKDQSAELTALRAKLDELTRTVELEKRRMEQVRNTVYGEDGKKEKDAALLRK